jgi:hypothetical protein
LQRKSPFRLGAGAEEFKEEVLRSLRNAAAEVPALQVGIEYIKLGDGRNTVANLPNLQANCQEDSKQ